MKRKVSAMLIDTVIIGLIGAASAQIFVFLLKIVGRYSLTLIAGYTPPDVLNILMSTKTNHSYSALLILPVIISGGLISGFLVYTFAPEAEGHGTDTAVRAFHRTGGYIRAIVTPLKIIASAITIGTGGSAGREGPTALFSSGVGSIYAKFRHASIEERRLFVLIGMASGLSAIFRAPIGTSIFAIEVLYKDMEFESSALVYTLLGSIIAYIATGFIMGWGSIFSVPSTLQATSLTAFFYLAILGLISGGIGVILPNVFYYTRDLFHKINIPPHFKPALGAMFVGIIALKFPQVLGGGYGWIQGAIDGRMAVNLLSMLLVAKMFAFTFTVSSGGSGGVFAPTLFLGAMLGGIFAQIFHQSSAAFAVIGMAAVFGSAARAPLATIIMVTEMTGGYHLLAPAAFTVLLAYLIQDTITDKLNLKYTSLYEAQVLNKSHSPVHQIETLKNILLCNINYLSLNTKSINDEKILNLLESGIPIELPNGKTLFFGTLVRNIDTTRKNGELFYKGARIIYIFRNGRWKHPNEIDKLITNDEVLLCGSQDIIDNIQDDFKRISYIFSKLKNQHVRLEKYAKKYIPDG